ncbi:hypothetical protein FSP39_002164 [Pinctada imbricata]|uniref:Uncharacterized protein n=1 Tax=Pinctada imbricata TaxID=66713 RepID=A0AA89BK27_PINIB|nr:hypothetical protein FSP39_002164 [Pinctada imbricata]
MNANEMSKMINSIIPLPVKMAGLNFALIVLTFISNFNQHVDEHRFLKTYRIEDLGFYVGTEVTFLNTSDLAVYELTMKWATNGKFREGFSRHTHCNLSQTLVINILLAGDVASNPGPIKFPCGICKKAVRSNQKGVACELCDTWFHTKCSNITPELYTHLSESEDDWFCFSCSLPKFSDSFFEDLHDANISNKSYDENPSVELESESTRGVKPPSSASPDHFQCFKRKGLHFLHLNARSLVNKISELQIIASESKAAIISVTESWLDDSVTNVEVNIDGYAILRRDRNRAGGGVCVYIREDLAFTPVQIDDSNDEILIIQLLLPKSKPIYIGTCYRPPHQTDFICNFEKILSQLRSDCEMYMLGDFNICFSDKNSSLFKSYSDVLRFFDLSQLIIDHTRVTSSSCSIIDHILCNNKEKICQSGVISIGLSDHFLTYCTRKSVKSFYNKHNNVKVRSMKNYDKDVFSQKLCEANWEKCFIAEDVNDAWIVFKNIFSETLDAVAPIKEIRLKQRTEPWITSDILEHIQLRDKLLYQFKKSRTEEDYSLYRKARNQVQYMCKSAKSNYFNDQVEENRNNPKNLWNQFKKLGYQQTSKSDINVVLEINDENCHDAHTIANHFNSFFTTIAAKLVEKLPSGKGLYHACSDVVRKFYEDRKTSNHKFVLSNVSEEFIFKELRNLNTGKSTGLDGIPARFLKDAAEVLKIPITFIINLSITNQTVPEDLKVAKVKPLFKKNNRLKPENYRPVSILSIVSKLLEKAIYNQLERFLVENNLLYEFQSGFRKSYSTDSCLIHLVDHIKLQTARGLFTGMVLLDLQKAFDTVDHEILCQKLEVLGVHSIDWFIISH